MLMDKEMTRHGFQLFLDHLDLCAEHQYAGFERKVFRDHTETNGQKKHWHSRAFLQASINEPLAKHLDRRTKNITV